MPLTRDEAVIKAEVQAQTKHARRAWAKRHPKQRGQKGAAMTTTTTTPPPIDTLPVGRELDRVIAEQWYGRDPLTARVFVDGTDEPHYHWGPHVEHSPADYYSTDNAAALRLLDTWPGDVDLHRSGGVWQVTLSLPPPRSLPYWADAETLSLAISRAVLLAAQDGARAKP